MPGPKFSIDGSLERFLRLPMTSPPEELEQGVRMLADAWAQLGVRAPVPTPERRPASGV
ncbi:hypothetical protein H4J02_10340 [Protaetiibacter sp. SSC-01]|uniref:hypothetical protein n=1 Tax=Protaetiibacter sp. SSC-01 TaxID=2759943 RepID=UPI001656B45D|nr:hypothetical protein [Protaetiibacter sp. SSC-01]QNO36866.1 hypothetical protein H4J02_10340 [Protaetiibacter sp. SSC-01]